MTLADLEPNQSARILALDATHPYALRLAELGLIKGQTLRVKRYAPLGDPVFIHLMNYDLCLRVRDARSVFVEPIA